MHRGSSSPLVSGPFHCSVMLNLEFAAAVGRVPINSERDNMSIDAKRLFL